MSYVPFRPGEPDNKDLAGLPADAYDRLLPLGDLIEASHLEGFHWSECNCKLPTCYTRENHGRPSTEEVLGWLVAKDLLNLDRVAEVVAAEQAAHVHTAGCMCRMVPMDVEGVYECFYCGPGSSGGPCGNRCDIARAEVIARG